MNSYKDDHMHDNGDEIIRLQSVQNSDHLKENDLVQKFRQNKYVVKISSYSFNLLMMFLQDRNFLTLLSILNRYVSIKMYTGHPQKTVEFQGYNYNESTSGKPKKVYCGIFEEQRKYFDKPDDDLDDASDGGMDVDGENKKRRRENKKKLQGAKRKKKYEEEDDDQVSNVPLPPMQTELENDISNDLKARVNLNSASLPSICFYTVFNSGQSLNGSTMSNDGSLFATGYNDSTIKLWDVAGTNSKWYKSQNDYKSRDGRDRKYNFDLEDPRNNYTDLVGHSQPVYGLDFSLDNRYLLSSSADGSVRLWSMESKTNVVCYKSHIFPVWDCKFSPLGYYFATASYDKTARLWATNNVNPLRIFVGHLGDVNTVDFHPNCNYLLTGSGDKSLRYWEVHSGECVRTFSGHLGPITSTSVSPDGRTFASGSDDKDIIIWDIASGKKVSTLKGHESTVWSLSTSGDGNILASGSGDNSIRLWDMRMLHDVSKNEGSSLVDTSKACLGVYGTKQTPVYKVSFTRRNLLLASGPFDQRSKIKL